jgi:hypothetical protein
MAKAAAVGIFVAAFFLALYFIFLRKPLTPERIAAASGGSKALLLACFSILAFLTGSPGCKPGARDATPADVQTVSQDAATHAQPPQEAVDSVAAEAASLAELRPLWDKLVHYTVYDSWKDDRQAGIDDVEKSKKAHAALVKELVAAGSLDEAAGEKLSALYDDMMDHLVRNFAGPTCYDMTMTGQFVYEFKKSAVERLAALEDQVKKGTLTKAAADKVEEAIARDLYFYEKLLAADEEANKGAWQAWNKKVDEIKAFYESQKHAIAKNDPSFKIADMIVNILSGGAAAK